MERGQLKTNMPIVALLGGSFVLACDIISRLIIAPYEVPIDLL
jgi:iron complex transport system permease protein